MVLNTRVVCVAEISYCRYLNERKGIITNIKRNCLIHYADEENKWRKKGSSTKKFSLGGGRKIAFISNKAIFELNLISS